MPIDLGQNQQSKAFVERQLRRFGVGSINDAISALARTIRDHKHLETFLTSIESQSDRQDVYDSIRPNLRFEPWPLDRYVASANSMAGTRMRLIIETPLVRPRQLDRRPKAKMRRQRVVAETLS